jgi:hypothetical protein
MGVLTKEKQLIVATKILENLQFGNAIVTRIDDQDAYINNPKIYNFILINEKIKVLWLFKFNKDTVRDAVDRLNENGHVSFKMYDKHNRYDVSFSITESGFKA